MFARFFRRRRLSDSDGLTGFLSPESFADHVAKERARTDRTHRPFAVIKFGIEGLREGATARDVLRVLADLLMERTRIIDTKGWLDGCLSVIFPDAADAEVLVIQQDVQEKFYALLRSRMPELTPAPRLSYEAFLYPDDQARQELRTLSPVLLELKKVQPKGRRPSMPRVREAQ